MSLKDLFGKKSTKILTSTNLEDFSKDVESSEYIIQELEERNLIKPEVDYTDPKNFAFFGSAKKYYTDAIEGVAKKYPYDGSSAEKLKWKKDSSDLQNYIFENEYPRHNGYVNIGFNYGLSSSVSTDYYSNPTIKEYILIKGGPNTATESQLKISSLFGTSNIFDPNENRESNLLLDANNGITTEFWLKKNNLSGSAKQVIFDLWNSSSFGSDYGRFRIEIHPGISGEENKFYIELSSGSYGILNFGIGQNLNINNSNWNHFAISTINSGSNLEFKLYLNGVLNEKIVTGSSIDRIYGPMLGYIGSLGTQVTGGNSDLGFGKLSGSLDEFRYWKIKRTEKEISRYWFTQINGGTNTDLSNTNLGVYFKFNEGIYSSSSLDTRYDNKVLDYSGRFSNGIWNGYSLGSRSINSAIVESGASLSEEKDPIIYLTHPDVQALLTEKQEIGTLYDNENNSMIYYTIPSWIVEEDEKNDSNKLYELTQIIGSYFDELFIKIKYLSSIKEVSYKNGRPFPYAIKLLQSMGFVTQDLFTNSSILENLANRNETSLYEQRLFDVKNHIYQNIYNNLAYIQKSKGTEKSIRNLLRCFGVDEELIKLNIYSNDAVYTFDDRFLNTYYKKKLINFNDPDRFQGTVYQMTASGESNSRSCIPGSSQLSYNGSTLEVEFMTPQKFNQSDKFYFPTNFLTSSVFGMHSADQFNQQDTTWYGSDLSNLEVYIIRPETDSADGYFFVTSSYLGINLTSSYIKDLYSNQKWNVSVKIKHDKYPNSLKVAGADVGDYIFEFYALNTVQDLIENEFYLTSTLPQIIAENYFGDSKRIYAGAHRQNFTGSVLFSSDIKLSNVKYWLSYLDNDVLKQHAKDPTIFGSKSPISNIETLYSGGLAELPQDITLALHWDFNLVTGSDNGSGTGPTNTYDGKFSILDVSSGSLSSEYSQVGNITSKLYTGRADFFFRNNTEMVENSYISIAKHRLPENIMNSDLINILNEDEQIFTRDTRPVNYYFALEKSMYQTISEEMIKFFGTITEFNNLIGRPQYKYEREYRDLIRLREMFFERVTNSPDLEKYIDYFKWIDSSVTKMVYQLVPASAEFSPNITDVVESHILERSKYTWKLPSIELGAEPPISSVKTIGELKYNWKYGHAPIPRKENTNCIWWKERNERSSDLNGIFQALSSDYKKKFTKISEFDTDIQILVDRNPITVEVIKPATKFGSGGYLEIDVLNLLEITEKKDCSDE